MTNSSPEQAPLPLGFERFHRRAFVNYQLNRAYALGFADRNELRAAAARVKSTDDCVPVFEDLSSLARADGRTKHATSYLRLAEFFTPPRSAAKPERYRRFRDLFDVAFASGGAVRHEVPYTSAALPAYLLGGSWAGGPRHGAAAWRVDSLIEEF